MSIKDGLYANHKMRRFELWKNQRIIGVWYRHETSNENLMSSMRQSCIANDVRYPLDKPSDFSHIPPLPTMEITP